MKQVPRYDSNASNPPGLKPSLSKVFNDTLEKLCIDCPMKQKIIIGNHNLDCSGGIREARYRNIQLRKYDGIHMFGPSGMKAYTASVINILNKAQLVKVTPPKYYDDGHKACNQARYQARHTNKRWDNSTQYSQKKVAPQAKSNQNNDYQYTVPTYSRFYKLGDFFPGN